MSDFSDELEKGKAIGSAVSAVMTKGKKSKKGKKGKAAPAAAQAAIGLAQNKKPKKKAASTQHADSHKFSVANAAKKLRARKQRLQQAKAMTD